MRLNRSFACKALHTLPVLPVYAIIFTVVASFTYFYTLDNKFSMCFAKMVCCLAFYFCASMTIICHTVAMFTDPGTAKSKFSKLIDRNNIFKNCSSEIKEKLDNLEQRFLENKIEEDEYNSKKLRHPLICFKCRIQRPERTHHCKHCNKCVLKMDHHCPWIANCVGFYNQKSFLLFLFYGTLGDFISFVCLSMRAYNSLYYLIYDPMKFAYGKRVNKSDSYFWQFFSVFWEPFAVFIGAALSMSMVLAIGMLFIHQIQILTKNFTGIEYYEYDKQEDSPWYVKGKFLCLSFILGVKQSKLKWMLPFFEPNEYNNGYSYYVPDNSNRDKDKSQEQEKKKEK